MPKEKQGKILSWISRLNGISRASLRTVSNIFHRRCLHPLSEKYPPLSDMLYKQQCILLCHDCLNGRAPKPISGSLELEQTIHATRSQANNPLNLRIPNLKSRAGSQSFRVKGPTIWNGIPNEIRSIERREVFKNLTKRLFLYRYLQKSECSNPRCQDHCFHAS